MTRQLRILISLLCAFGLLNILTEINKLINGSLSNLVVGGLYGVLITIVFDKINKLK